LMQVGHVGGERGAGTRVDVMLEYGDLPAIRHVDRRDTVIPISARAAAAREIVEVRRVAQHRPAISPEVGICVDHDRVAGRPGGIVVVAA